ncbi:ATP/cobalamin adenosyltransferase [archaeon GW2011_AR15]|nr:ATP/cobalamin adenosyltransferase [archaeon GW2011_AR15]
MADRKIKIYTKRGDTGETSLCDGSRTLKDTTRVEAYGVLDETNAFLGLAIVKLEEEDLKSHLMDIQKDLHAISSNLAYPSVLSQSKIDGNPMANKIPRVTEDMVKKLERLIDMYEEELPVLKNFILAGGTEESALLHMARVVCRRAERQIIRLMREEEIEKNILKYMNRLSDYLFTAARLASHRQGKEDTKWMP